MDKDLFYPSYFKDDAEDLVGVVDFIFGVHIVPT